jgi:hypothetical protein
MSDERRAARRFGLWIPVQIASGPEVRMLAVSRNISWSGALMIVGASMDVGEQVELTLQLPGSAEERQLKGEIVRVETNDDDPDGLWRYRLAVKFDEPVPDLEPAFEALEAKAQK